MVVEPYYPLLSAELGSAKALVSSQQKFQTLNLADCNVTRQFRVVCSLMCLGMHGSDEICKLNFPFLATNDKIELDDLYPNQAAEGVKNFSEHNEKGVDFKSPLEVHKLLFLQIIIMEVANTGTQGVKPLKKGFEKSFFPSNLGCRSHHLLFEDVTTRRT